MHGRTQLHRPVTRALRPQPRGKGRDWRTHRRQSGARSPQRPAGPGRARRGRREKGCSRGVGQGRWGRGRCPNSHSPPRSPPGPGSAARPYSGASRSRLLPRLKDQSGCTKMGRGRREPRERGEPGRGGGEAGTVALAARGHLTHDRGRLHSATEAADPPTTPGPASAPSPARERRPC